MDFLNLEFRSAHKKQKVNLKTMYTSGERGDGRRNLKHFNVIILGLGHAVRQFLMGTTGYRLLDLRSRNIRALKRPFPFTSSCSLESKLQQSNEKPVSKKSKLYLPHIYNKMHVKSFVFASFAACIVTAIPIPDEGQPLFCPAEWKRSPSPQNGCRPQTLKLPTLNDLPLSQNQYNGLETYPTDAFSKPSLSTPADTAASPNRPAPQPLDNPAPWLAVPGAGIGTWAVDQLLNPKVPGDAPRNGN